METFIELKGLTDNPHYPKQKKKVLSALPNEPIDIPIKDLIKGFNSLPYCFTLQSCYGHFVYNGTNSFTLDPLPGKNGITKVEYRIAYIAFCIENSPLGRKLLETLKKITHIDPENIQFCCAEWFWERQVNSYALQVEPDRFKHEDTATLDFNEALQIEKIRNTFFVRLHELLENEKGR